MTIVCLIAAASVSFLFTNCTMKPVAPHHGDGKFQKLSRWAGPFPLPGYSISMPTFDLGQPFQAEYQVARLTDIGRDCGVHLAVADPQDHWLLHDTRRLEGNLALQLIDSNGVVIVSTSGRLGEYTWMGWNNIHALYQLDRSFFRPNPSERYRLILTYDPDPNLAGYQGFAYLLCRASL